jgi:hypothetical protein
VPFYRPERWVREVSLGGGARWPRVKRRKREGCWGFSRVVGNLERLPARQDKARLSNSEGSLGGIGCQILSFLARFRCEKVTRREGEGKWGCCRVSRASWTATGAAGQVVHLHSLKSDFFPFTCSTECPQENNFRNFENIQLAWTMHCIWFLDLCFLCPEVEIWCYLKFEFQMASVTDSNFGKILNRVPSCFWFQTLLELILCNLFLGVVKRCMRV